MLIIFSFSVYCFVDYCLPCCFISFCLTIDLWVLVIILVSSNLSYYSVQLNKTNINVRENRRSNQDWVTQRRWRSPCVQSKPLVGKVWRHKCSRHNVNRRTDIKVTRKGTLEKGTNNDLQNSTNRGSLYISHENYIKDGKVLVHLGFLSKVFPGSLTDLSAWVGFCTHSRLSNINFDIWKKKSGGGLYKYPTKNILQTAKFLPTWGLSQGYCPTI